MRYNRRGKRRFSISIVTVVVRCLNHNIKGNGMHRTSAIQAKEMVLVLPLAATMQNVTGQLTSTSSNSRKIYVIDGKHFARWMASQDLSLFSLLIRPCSGAPQGRRQVDFTGN